MGPEHSPQIDKFDIDTDFAIVLWPHCYAQDVVVR
jgi:hypothetical protein